MHRAEGTAESHYSRVVFPAVVAAVSTDIRHHFIGQVMDPVLVPPDAPVSVSARV